MRCKQKMFSKTITDKTFETKKHDFIKNSALQEKLRT